MLPRLKYNIFRILQILIYGYKKFYTNNTQYPRKKRLLLLFPFWYRLTIQVQMNFTTSSNHHHLSHFTYHSSNETVNLWREFPLFYFWGILPAFHTIKDTSFLSTEHNEALLANDMEPTTLIDGIGQFSAGKHTFKSDKFYFFQFSSKNLSTLNK
jgi:hypothetical protein